MARIRLRDSLPGWDHTCIVATEAAAIVEAAGAAALTLHPRTTKQSFSGQADWSLIAAVKQALSIPVVGNGDVRTPQDALRMFRETGCDAVMVARGALGRPWFFRQIGDLLAGREPREASLSEVVQVCRRHFDLLRADRSEQLAVNLTKKHFSHYLKGFPGAVDWRKAFLGAESTDAIGRLLDDLEQFAAHHDASLAMASAGQSEPYAA